MYPFELHNDGGIQAVLQKLAPLQILTESPYVVEEIEAFSMLKKRRLKMKKHKIVNETEMTFSFHWL